MLKFFGMQKVRPKEFGYKPRYYDPAKEELENRIKQREADDNGLIKSRIRSEFSAHRRNKKGGLLSSSSFRIILIIIALLFFGYVVLENYLPRMMEFWFPEEVSGSEDEFY